MIIITGGLGFIGSNLVADISERKLGEIVVCDFLDEHKKPNIAKHKIKALIEPDDLMDYLESHRKDIEVIFHMGAISSTVEQDVALITRTNFDLPLRLWHWCIENDTRFLYASSAATYGDGSQGFVDDDSLEYLKNLKPLNPYGQSKNNFDIEAVKLAAEGKAPPQWAGFKFFNVFGPNEYHKEGQKSVVCQMYKQLNKTGKVRLFKSYKKEFEDGGQRRDFVYVKDCSEVMLWFHKNKNANGIFNIGTGKARSFNDLAASVFSAMDKGKPNIEYFDMPEQIRDRYQYLTEASLTKLRKVGYVSSFTSLEDSVSDYIRNYLSKKDQYR